VECGGYYYVYNDSKPAAEAFTIVIPGKASTEPYTAVRATIQTTSPIFFGAVFGANPFTVRPTPSPPIGRANVVIIMDLSGSMRFQSCPGGYYDGTYLYRLGPRNNLESGFRLSAVRHYSATSTAAMREAAATRPARKWSIRPI